MLRARPAWTSTDDAGRPVALDARLPALLRAIASRGTLLVAARDLGVPYRTAWAIVEAGNDAIGGALVASTRGRGARLTPLAQRWLAADDEAAALLAARIEPIEIPDVVRPARALRVAASHDLALAQLRDRWRVAHGVTIEFHGSLESLAAYEAGQVDVAGFHVATDAPGDDPMLRALRVQRDAVLRFLRREQGLILPPGNPRRVRSLDDVVERGLAIVNRQPGSGTRALLDRMLDAAGVDRSAVRGYGNEEFTHAAVAATIAAGNADAGLGVRAAAHQFKLAFVPLTEEHYLFACRRAALDTPMLQAFRRRLADVATRKVVAPLPGYRLDRPGQLVEPKAAGVEGWRRALRGRAR